jgi:hypothetical protein
MAQKVFLCRYPYDKSKLPHNKWRDFATVVRSHGGSREAVTINGDSGDGVFKSADPTLQPRVTLHGVITQRPDVTLYLVPRYG